MQLISVCREPTAHWVGVFSSRRLFGLVALLTLFWLPASVWSAAGAGPAGRAERSLGSGIKLQTIAPDPRGGKAYRLTYDVAVDVNTYWCFKTDFSNPMIEDNKYIKSHRMVSRSDGAVVTEDVYTYDTVHVFRWQTMVNVHSRRLDFRLLNATECGQLFHHGSILVAATKGGTRVTQTAYFDFWGANLWFHYPWSGGMRDLLRYHARWEQQLVPQLLDRYSSGK
jgi:hypothetical protein